ncbi:MAG: M81 family peptidase [Lacunisphaera sp.]|nr:M81 family peptidase [Lacunisphaera sp.]
MPKRVLLAGLFHESHTFLTAKTPRADFSTALGRDILAMEGNGSPIAGFLSVARAMDWEVLPTVDMRAMPSGLVEESAIDYFWSEFSTRARPWLEEGIDAIFLVLHGAMVSEKNLDVEGELLARIRQLPGAATLPVFAVLDLHANVSPRMAEHADALVAYRENPHTDAYDTAGRAANLLARCLTTGIRPKTILRRLPVIWAPPGTGTATDPMLALMLMASKMESTDPTVWAVNIAAGFSFADTPDTGVSVSVVADGPGKRLTAQLEAIARKAWDLRSTGEARYPTADDVLQRIMPISNGPVLLVDPADNIGGGAPGDCTGVLRALLKHDVPDSLVVINDPAAVHLTQASRVGGTLTLAIGGKGSPLDAGPITLAVTLISRSNGQFDLEDAHSHLASMVGRHFDMGDCAVVRHRGVTVLLTSKKTPPFDLGQLRSQSIEPKDFKVISVKAAVAHKRAYDPIARASHLIEAPGPCSSDFGRFVYRHVRRPVFPLDAGAGLDLSSLRP